MPIRSIRSSHDASPHRFNSLFEMLEMRRDMNGSATLGFNSLFEMHEGYRGYYRAVSVA